MQETGNWLADFGQDQQNLRFPAVYWLAMMTLILGTIGMLWALPVPAEFRRISPILNWGSAFLMAAMVYYFIISMALAVGMLPLVFGIALVQIRVLDLSWSPAQFSAGLFLLSLPGLYFSRAGDAGIAMVFRDIQLMMIAPIWGLSKLYQRVGIPY